MTDLNKHLAEQVMGWTVKTDKLGFHIYHDSFDAPRAALENTYWENIEEHWNPSENIEQAMMVISKFEQWDINHQWAIMPQGRVTISPENSDKCYYENFLVDNLDSVFHSLPMAISLSSAKATGWKDD